MNGILRHKGEKHVSFTQKRGKDQTLSYNKSIQAKGRDTRNLMVHLKEHHAKLYAEALSGQRPRDRLTKGKNAKLTYLFHSKRCSSILSGE